MNTKGDNDKITAKEKMHKDRFKITIVGVIIYSLALITVMVLSYMGVKAVFRTYDSQVAAEEGSKETADTVSEKVPEKEEAADVSEPEEPEEEPVKDHDVDPDGLMDPETGIVDYSVTKFTPGKRSKNLKWKDTVFSRIENVKDGAKASVNTFDYKRVSVKLPDNNSAEYRVYTNPDTDAVEKITEYAEKGNSVEVYDYYFDDGHINYVDGYKTYVDKPVDISSSDMESRYYFDKDVLVRYIYCSNGKATEYNIADFDTYSKGTADQYDYLESEMINRAYIVYNVAPSVKETELLYGYVVDEFSMPMEDAAITVRSEEDDRLIAETTTDGDGYYKIAVDCNDDETYKITAEKYSLTSVSVYGITARFGSAKYAVEPIYLPYDNNTTQYPVQFSVRDATDPNKPLSGAGIMIRRGLYNRSGEVMQTGSLDNNGTGTVALTSGSYTAEVTKGGYETLFMSVIVRLDHQFAIGFATPDVGEDEYRVVVSWESAPLDLAVKAVSSNRGRIIGPSVDSLGLTSAEPVTIDKAGTDDYRLYVTDFGSITSADTMSYRLTGSNAYADVYNSDGMMGSFHVPVASAGVIWEPFEIRNKTLLPVNSFYYAIEDDDLWKTK